MKFKDKATFNLKEVIAIILITSLAVSLFTSLVMLKRMGKPTSVNKNTNEYISTFIDAYDTLINNYYEKVDQKVLIDSLISNLYDSVKDPYTTYLSKEETEELLQTLKGEYEGIGVRVSNVDTSKGIQIVDVFDNSPASEVGLQPNDLIIKVNNTEVINKTADEVVTYIKSNSQVNLVVNRNNKELSFNLQLKEVDIPSIESELYKKNNNKIGYIYISTFAVNTYEQFNDKLQELEKQKIDSLIIDVRTNTGGYLTTTTEIAELFIEKGKTIYEIENKDGKDVYNDNTNEKRDYPIVVLINEISASASEVLTAALKESYGATLVGKKTYGKGKIQQTTSLEDGGMLKYTTAKWLTPKGECIDTKGITPDYEIEYEKDNDKQLNKALELLSK